MRLGRSGQSDNEYSYEQQCHFSFVHDYQTIFQEHIFKTFLGAGLRNTIVDDRSTRESAPFRNFTYVGRFRYDDKLVSFEYFQTGLENRWYHKTDCQSSGSLVANPKNLTSVLSL